jgi:hypothetical protein
MFRVSCFKFFGSLSANLEPAIRNLSQGSKGLRSSGDVRARHLLTSATARIATEDWAELCRNEMGQGAVPAGRVDTGGLRRGGNEAAEARPRCPLDGLTLRRRLTVAGPIERAGPAS